MMNLKAATCHILITTFVLFFALSSHAEEPFKIGWIGPLSGNAAVLGIDSAEAVSMVVDRVNKNGGIHNRKIKLYLEDDRYETKRTMEAYKKLVHMNGVRVLFIITYGGLFAAAPLAQRDGVVLLDPLDCNEDIAMLPENTFCVSQMTEAIGRSNAEQAFNAGHVPVGILYFANDPFMGTLAKATAKRLEELGSKPVYYESYTDAEVDFKTYLVKAKKSQVKSLFFYGYDTLGVGMKQARALGFKIPFYATATITSPGHQASAGSAANGTTVSVWKAPRNLAYQSFLEEFHARTKRNPALEISTIPSYDLAQILVQTLKNRPAKDFGSSEIDIAQLKQVLYGLDAYQGLSGEISMSADGAARSLKVRKWHFEEGDLVALNFKFHWSGAPIQTKRPRAQGCDRKP